MNSYPKNPCKYCGSMGHWSFQCWKRPQKKITTKGKTFNQWQITRKTWFKKNPPELWPYPHYVCYICKVWLHPEETTLDHVLSRSRHPELRFVQSNLKPCCWNCNTEKGSKDGEI